MTDFEKNMTRKQLPHQRARQPCAKCKSKDRVRVCAPCYAELRDEVERLRSRIERVVLKLYFDGETTRLDPNANGPPILQGELEEIRDALNPPSTNDD